MLELSGGKWREDPAAPTHPGVSLTGTFNEDVPIARSMLWWLHEGNRAIRVGDWKLVAARDDPWELYDLREDREENHDLAAKLPNKVKEMEAAWLMAARQFQEDRQENLTKK
jgi:arylsulfatase